jgi:hypothetical protein
VTLDDESVDEVTVRSRPLGFQTERDDVLAACESLPANSSREPSNGTASQHQSPLTEPEES